MATDYEPLPLHQASYPEPARPFNWTGFYGTLNLGFNRMTTTATELATVPDDATNCAPAVNPNTGISNGIPAGMYWCNVNGARHYTSTPTLSYNQVGNSWSQNTMSVTAGVEASYLSQAPQSSFVWGVAADFNYLHNAGMSGNAPTTDDTTMGLDASSFATARVIAGFSRDRWLAYATGGAAYGNFNAWVEDMDTPVGIRTTPTRGQWGFAAGAGVAYAVDDNWAIKAEYLMLDFPGATTAGYGNLTCGYVGQDASVCAGGAGSWKTTPLSNPPTGGFAWNIANVINVARVGLSYKF